MADDTSWLMAGAPPAADAVVGVHNWSTTPYLRWGFLHTREVVPTARIERGEGPVLELPRDERDLDGIEFADAAGETTTVGAMLDDGFTDGFLVLHHGRIVAERYGNGMTARTTHLLQSVSKSIAGTVAGVLVERGLLDPEGPVTDYLPELAGTSFEGATVRHVLDMRTGTAYDETYDDPKADVFLTEALAGWRPMAADPDAANVYEQITQLGNARAHGEVFDYRSILTELLGWLMERTSGVRYPELLSQELWSKIGAEQDADITIRHGVTLPDGGICVTLRDLARFALLHLRAGQLEGRQIIPRDWVFDTRTGDAEARDAYARSEDAKDLPGGMYRNQWWVLNDAGTVYTGLGIHGQFAWIDTEADVVCVKLSTWPTPLDEARQMSGLNGFASIAAHLSA